jgi:hypothetical protein
MSDQIRIVLCPTGSIGKAALKVVVRPKDVDVADVYDDSDTKLGTRA